MSSPVSIVTGDPWKQCLAQYLSRQLRPTQPGHHFIGGCSEYWQWFQPQPKKKWRVLCSSWPCDQECWHTGLVHGSLICSDPRQLKGQGDELLYALSINLLLLLHSLYPSCKYNIITLPLFFVALRMVTADVHEASLDGNSNKLKKTDGQNSDRLCVLCISFTHAHTHTHTHTHTHIEIPS